MRALTRYNLLLFGVLLVTLGGGFFLNTWVNPWRVTPMPWTAAKFEEYRGIDQAANRTCKAGLARSQKWDAAIFGSSRANIGFNPEDPAWGDLKAVNLGLYAASIDENTAIFDYFMATQSPSLVVFLVDMGDLSRPYQSINTTDFATSPLPKDSRPLERELRYHTGISAALASIQVWKREIHQKPEAHSPRGFRRIIPHSEDASQMASLYLKPLMLIASERARLNGLNPDKIRSLHHIMEACRAKHTRLIFVIPPNHATYQLAYAELKNVDPYFSRDRQALAEAVDGENSSHPEALPVDLWDFQDAHPLNTPPLPLAAGSQMENWIDMFHFKPVIGALIIRRIRGEAGEYGVRLNSGNVEARMQQVVAGYEAWAESHPEDMAFLRKSLRAYGGLPQTPPSTEE